MQKLLKRALSLVGNKEIYMEPIKKQKLASWEECEKTHMAFKFAYIGFNYDVIPL